MSDQATLNIRNIDPAVVQAFRREAFERGMTHGELLAELVTRKGGDNG